MIKYTKIYRIKWILIFLNIQDKMDTNTYDKIYKNI